jgi:two-component system response regulator RegX3
MWQDPIVAEVRQAREAHAAQFNLDLQAIYRAMKAKILIVDDEPEDVSAFARILKQEGYEVKLAKDDLWALYLYDEFRPDLIILDICFGDNERKGVDILKEIRVLKNDPKTPIIMLTGLADDGLNSLSYNRDADYFVSKSVPTKSLLALVKRCLRRSKPGFVKIDDRIEIDLGNYRITVKEDGKRQPVHFEPKEFEVLEKLVINRGQVITREELYDQFFSDAKDPANALNRCISELRKKLEPDPRNPQYILTIRGVGYMFKGDR